MNSPPQILEVLVKEQKSGNRSEYKFFYIKVVVKVEDEEDIESCKRYSEEFCKDIMYCVEDPEDITKHYMDSVLADGDKPSTDISEKIMRGFVHNPRFIFSEEKESGVFIYKEYVEDNEITRAVVAMLKRLRDNPTSDHSRFVLLSGILRAITCLDAFWD